MSERSFWRDIELSENAMYCINFALILGGIAFVATQIRACEEAKHKATPAIVEACKAACQNGLHEFTTKGSCECK